MICCEIASYIYVAKVSCDLNDSTGTEILLQKDQCSVWFEVDVERGKGRYVMQSKRVHYDIFLTTFCAHAKEIESR